MDSCGVCEGVDGQPVCTVTVTADDTGEDVSIRLCRRCAAGVFGAMDDLHREIIDRNNAAVAYLCEMLGIEA